MEDRFVLCSADGDNRWNTSHTNILDGTLGIQTLQKEQPYKHYRWNTSHRIIRDGTHFILLFVYLNIIPLSIMAFH